MADDYYSGIASGYDELYGEEQRRKLAHFLSRVTVEGSLLDVGCATGWTHDVLEGVRWQGLEPSPGLIRQAPDGIRNKIVLGGAEDIPFPDNMFENVLCLTVLQNVRDIPAAISEIRRVSRSQVLLSFLKRAERADMIDKAIREHLRVEAYWGEEKDKMYICRP